MKLDTHQLQTLEYQVREQGSGSILFRYEHWEEEKAGEIMYGIRKMLIRHLEGMIGGTITVVIENTRDILQKEFVCTRIDDGNNDDGDDDKNVQPPEPTKPHSRAQYFTLAA